MVRNIIFLLLIIGAAVGFQYTKKGGVQMPSVVQSPTITPTLYPLAIEAFRSRTYESTLSIDEELPAGSNYRQYLASYRSDGLKINGLLTVPTGEKPKEGFPVVIFNHGYIPPDVYQTTERYVSYVDAFARNGYIVFKSDYRGHGNSEGRPEGAYFSPAYTVDVLNAVAAIKKFKDANPNKIGMWGHSMGGNITLRSIVVSKDVKAAVIWGGVVGTYDDLINNWRRSTPWQPSERERFRSTQRARLVEQYGNPKDGSGFWKSIDPYTYLADVSAPVQLHHGSTDEEVPQSFAEHLDRVLSEKSKVTEYYLYQGADHNISGSAFNTAMQRSVAFFDKYLK